MVKTDFSDHSRTFGTFGEFLRRAVLPTDNVISRVFIESSALKQVVTIHLGMAAERAGLVRSQWRTHSGQRFRWLSKALGFLGRGSSFANVCSYHTLCSSEGHGDFRLRRLSSCLAFWSTLSLLKITGAASSEWAPYQNSFGALF
ncbi:hypothetical protein TNCV_1452351 [Trichonephila clavipes]|nr:hypothetical protein TNCV_1452351 [Trichonephila clavipes]